ncbi:sodium/hydrogen exchanger 9B2-like [Rhopalosiphum maidis]|uniref:sodium/hydrogen exchanger 9B2-like n=1 Tax=Rhopalosiphum maidis TaxID=43146 RepID=UPI000EFF0A4E|nr:sodium/hydrogen exchanger 9B2-like [Rhopalosiphum maidis]XP_026804821.1 sodium/hydrogen exchanger 9B2-like [Rhopalosiphum maidis]XP_026804822.1 sodium/hydrogen exchanger 9B2-like [Rhopalosiphum maidis]
MGDSVLRLSDPPDEQPLQLQRRDDGDGQWRFDHSDDARENGTGDVVAMSWCDDRLPATVANVAAAIIGVAIAWSLLYVNVSPELMAVPGGSLSSIFMLYVIGAAAGWVINKIIGLPPRFGMLLAGIALQNAGLYTVTGWCSHLVSFIREVSLAVTLINGGLELDASQLRRLSGVVAKLTLLPCLAEAAAVGIAAHLILPGFSWQWSLVLGFTLSAVSPAILVPGLFQLKRLGYGEVKGVNTLLIAASSLDNIVSICAFRIVLGVLFMTGSVTSKIIQGLIDVSLGTVLGVIWGFFLIFVPPSPWAMIYKKPKTENSITSQRLNRLITAKRSFLLGAGGFLVMTGSRWCGYPVAGPLACIISAFVASTGWRWRLKMQNRNNSTISVDENCDDEDQDQEKPVEKVFEYIWDGLQPSVFAFLGTDIKFELLKNLDKVLGGLLVLTFGITVRMIVTTCSVLGSGFSRKEIIFVNISWLPKATIQAILAPFALIIAKDLGTPEDVECGTRLVTIAVISILFTAPIGSIGIKLFGPRLLPRAN